MRHVLLILLVISALLSMASSARADLRIRHICRVKGQEENTLEGFGLVVGLKGTGDADTPPTQRALAKMMQSFGNNIARGPKGEDLLVELKNVTNVALVVVTANVPAAGGRQGSTLNCSVKAIGAKSLEGGYLIRTPLKGPQPNSPQVFAFAQGHLTIEDPSRPTSGIVQDGCQLEEDFNNLFVKDDKFTLVINRNHASFANAQEIAQTINNIKSLQDGRSPGAVSNPAVRTTSARKVSAIAPKWARAIDPVNVEVQIPDYDRANPVSFLGMILDEPLVNRNSDARVVINERTGVIVVGSDVEIGPVVVKHKGFVIETVGLPSRVPAWAPLDATGTTAASSKLKNLVDALNALKAPSDDIIEVIKSLDTSGNLYGHLIFE